MSDVTMRAGEVLRAAEVVQHLLTLHAPLPADVDKGASMRAGVKLRRIRRALSGPAEDIEEMRDAARTAALRERDPDAAFQAACKALAVTTVTLTIPELLTREDWDTIPMQAPGTVVTRGADGQPVTTPTTIRKTEADLDALGPLFDESEATT